MTDYNHDPLVPRVGVAASLAAAVAYTNEMLWTSDTQNLYVEQGGSKILVGGLSGLTCATALVAGYVPYCTVAPNVLDDSPIYTDGTNFSIGSTTANGKLDVWNGNLTLSDSDVAHGMTDFMPTTVFAKFSPYSATAGGLDIVAMSDADSLPLRLLGIFGADPTDTFPAITLYAGKKNGTGIQALAAAETVLKIQNYTTDLVTVLGSGNVGFNTTDIEAWNAAYKAIEFGAGNSLMYEPSAANFYLSTNYYFSDAAKRKAIGLAAQYQQLNGNHYFYTAATGAADSAISWITALTIGPTGGVHVGGTSDPGDNNLLVDGTLHVDGVATFDAQVDFGTAHGTTLLIDHIGQHTAHNVVFDNTVQMSAGLQYINDTANAQMTIGLTINQDGNDDEILAFKSSDVAHGITDITETDTFGLVKKFSATGGGLRLDGATESTVGIAMFGFATTAIDTTTADSYGCSVISSYKKSGTGYTVFGADENIFIIQNAGSGGTKFIFKGDGDLYYDGADQGAYDAFDDALACQDLSMNLSNQLGKVLKYNKKKLHDMGVISCEGDDLFVSRKGMDMLQLGAIGELYRVCQKLCERQGITFEEAKCLQ